MLYMVHGQIQSFSKSVPNQEDRWLVGGGLGGGGQTYGTGTDQVIFKGVPNQEDSLGGFKPFQPFQMHVTSKREEIPPKPNNIINNLLIFHTFF